jgi:hypothetical protein
MKTRIQGLVIALAALTFSACTTLQPLAVDSTRLARTLKQGDEVHLVTVRGQALQFEIERLDNQGIQGNGQRVAYEDIQSISRKQISAGRTTLLALGVVAAGALAASGGGSSGGSGY